MLVCMCDVWFASLSKNVIHLPFLFLVVLFGPQLCVRGGRQGSLTLGPCSASILASSLSSLSRLSSTSLAALPSYS
jgi:hypothetical protein